VEHKRRNEMNATASDPWVDIIRNQRVRQIAITGGYAVGGVSGGGARNASSAGGNGAP
jgi:hypothetical protein